MPPWELLRTSDHPVWEPVLPAGRSDLAVNASRLLLLRPRISSGGTKNGTCLRCGSTIRSIGNGSRPFENSELRPQDGSGSFERWSSGKSSSDGVIRWNRSPVAGIGWYSSHAGRQSTEFHAGHGEGIRPGNFIQKLCSCWGDGKRRSRNWGEDTAGSTDRPRRPPSSGFIFRSESSNAVNGLPPVAGGPFARFSLPTAAAADGGGTRKNLRLPKLSCSCWSSTRAPRTLDSFRSCTRCSKQSLLVALTLERFLRDWSSLLNIGVTDTSVGKSLASAKSATKASVFCCGWWAFIFLLLLRWRWLGLAALFILVLAGMEDSCKDDNELPSKAFIIAIRPRCCTCNINQFHPTTWQNQKKTALIRVQRHTTAPFCDSWLWPWPQNKWVSRTHCRTFVCQVWWS